MKIAVLDDWAGAAREAADWSSLCAEVTVFRDPIPAADLVTVLAPFTVLCVMRERMPLSAALLNALPALRLVVTTGARNLAIDLAAAEARGIVVCGTQSRKTTTAELTLALILAQNRALGVNAAHLATGGFQAALGRDMAGLRIGLLASGRLGGRWRVWRRPLAPRSRPGRRT
ncbi:hypothetical protein [Phaeovulum sp. W22_SRMD_FR3]|uniref:hypothetical protein n=1 Tax=Phaeovulum sp. W22_SRMD_FR3 TaxID=3240274 RepID=UPI003F9A488F